MIKIQNLCKSYGEQPLFRGINLEVEKGSVVTVIGPSGSGKSTLLRCINGLESFQSGCVSVDNQIFCGIDERNHNREQSAIALKNIRTKVGMVFQQFNLFPHMSVLQNITAAPVHVSGLTLEDAELQAIALLKKVHIEEKAKSYPAQLSGGEQQRVAIARALAMKPEVMLFDEPTSSLDPEMIGEVLQVIKELVSEGMTTIIVTHEMQFARDISTQVVFMDKGEIVECGSPDEVFSHPDNERTKIFFRRIFR